jgi:hypothetical protein
MSAADLSSFPDAIPITKVFYGSATPLSSGDWFGLFIIFRHSSHRIVEVRRDEMATPTVDAIDDV